MNQQVSFILNSLLNGFTKGFGGKPNGMPEQIVNALKTNPVKLKIDLANVGGRVTTSGYAMFQVNFEAANGLPAFSGNIPAVDFVHLVNNGGTAHFQAKSWKTDDGQERWSIYNVDAPATVSPTDIQAAIDLFSPAGVPAGG